MAQPESKLSREIQSHIRARGGFVFKVHGGPFTMNGVPDIAGVYRGVSIWVETKMPAGKDPTDIQKLRHQQIMEAGGHVLIARSVEDVQAWLNTVWMSPTPGTITGR
jgi:hypothetical protein